MRCPTKCVVTGCKTNYLTSGTSKQVFKFPDNIELRAKWTEFTNRKDFSATKYSTICVDHFSEYDGQTLTGCDSNFQIYRSILCYMVVSLTSSVPFMIKAVPLTKISSNIVCSGIISCIEILNQNNIYLRGITSDNHPTNVSCYQGCK